MRLQGEWFNFMSPNFFGKLFKSGSESQDRKKKRYSIEHFLMEAIFEFENGEFRDSIEHFRMLLRLDPGNPLANLFLARCHIESKDYGMAIVYLLDHLNIIHDSVEALILLGLCYFECGETKLAEERFEQALKLKKDVALIKENLAIVEIADGKYEAALNRLVGIHWENPKNRDILEMIVLTLGKLGRWEEAKNYSRLAHIQTPA